MLYKSVLPQLFVRIAVDGAVTPADLRQKVADENERVQQEQPELDDDMYHYVVERNIWRALYSDEYGNTIPRFTGIKPAAASQHSTIKAGNAELQLQKPVEVTRLTTNAPRQVSQSIAQQASPNASLSTTRSPSIPQHAESLTPERITISSSSSRNNDEATFKPSRPDLERRLRLIDQEQ
ncbi:hypothetical protein DL98DRAFT_633849 [Cadophora sp. DSE1049]|nr:hypothetical protein DL98DRAFT_633849 [Cadophora sp. DSE1049]